MITKKKQIVWFYPHLRFWMGGNRFLYEVARRLTKRYQVTIVTNLGKKKFIDKFKKSRVEVKTILPFCSNDIIYWLFFPFFLFLEIIKSINYAKNADYLFATLFPSNFVAYILAKIFKKKYIFYCYEPYPFFHNKEFILRHGFTYRLILNTLALIYKKLDIIASSKADLIFTIDEFKNKEIKKIYKKEAIITGVGLDFNLFKKTNIKLKEYKNFLFHSTDYTELKRTELVIKAFYLVNKKFPKIKLYISSTQPNSKRKYIYYQLVEKLKLNGKVKFLEFIKEKELPIFYSNAICYLSGCTDPITAGNWPVKESLACGTPAIRSRIGTYDVVDGKSGFIVDPENTQEYANKINFLVANIDKSIKMGNFGMKEMKKRYLWDKVINVIGSNIKKL